MQNLAVMKIVTPQTRETIMANFIAFVVGVLAGGAGIWIYKAKITDALHAELAALKAKL